MEIIFEIKGFMLNKALILIIKYIPIIQMIGILANNILYSFGIQNNVSYHIFDFLVGNSVVTAILLWVCSNVFKFCSWHRLLIISNFIVVIMIAISILFPKIYFSEVHLINLCYVIYLTTILIILVLKFKSKKICT